MDKSILDIVNDLAQWKGDGYKLAALVAEQQKQLDRDKLIAAGLEASAEVL